MLVLFTDTDCDMTPESCKKYGYNLISMPYIMNDKEIYPYVDFDEFDYHTFYNTLRSGVVPKTCAINPEKYVEYFEPHFAAGNDILYVHFSRQMSGTFNAMNIALEELKEKYPERKFYTIDTKGITIVSRAIALEVGELVLAGKSIDEILKWAETEVEKFAIYFYADDLRFFAKSGRVSGFSAFMGGMLGIHPIIYMSSEGQMVSIDKAMGRNNTLNKLFSYVEKLQDHIEDHRIIIAHADCLPIALQFKKMLVDKYGDKLNIEFCVVNPTAGSHCGPNVVGVCFHAIHR